MDETFDNFSMPWSVVLAELAAWAVPACVRSRFDAIRSEASPGDRHQIGEGSAKPASTDDAVNALASMIEASRRQAIADGVKPLPSTIYHALLGYFPPGLLQKVRCASARHNPLTLPVQAGVYGDAVALALGEVVLFKTDKLAQADLKLWAHELTHVMQYQRWGVEGFADHYVRDSAGVEQEAIDNADRFGTWLSRRAS